ncbi:hypothetical protein RJ55_03107 [Drechmeria coniospora]|nr:hypothetical protein RJ55_03107 [Drechmeria coniospora]
MAPPLSSASIELDYPLYALDFDPEDANRLVVGGGGGPGHSGVGNKITVLERDGQDELRIAGAIDLPRDEDCVMSLALAGRKSKSTQILAGVNSSPAEMAKGINQHLRTLVVESSKSRASAGVKAAGLTVRELSRTALFEKPSPDAYQRRLRLAGTTGVVSTGMGNEPQIAVFDTAGGQPRAKGVVELAQEAEDVDVVQTGQASFQLAFCHKYELHVLNISKKKAEPELIFTMPDDDGGARPVFRSLRYLTPEFILAVANLPGRSGVLIQCLRLPAAGRERAGMAATARIPRKMSASALAVVNLAPGSTSWARAGNTQFLIAVAGNDSSISLYGLEHKASNLLHLLSGLDPICTLKDVHVGGNITGVAFSRFVTPKTHTRQQSVRLASISMQKTVVMHSIPLRKQVETAPARGKDAAAPTVRYVSSMKPRAPSSRPLVAVLTLFVLIMAMVGQAVMEMYGRSEPFIFANSLLPAWHGTLGPPDFPSAAFFDGALADLFAGGKAADGREKVVLLDTDHAAASADTSSPDGKIKADVYDSDVHGAAKAWEELGDEEKDIWRERLREAGAWTQGMGENVFKGVFFGQIAAAIGDAVAN